MYSKSHYFVLAEDTLKEMLGPSMKEQWLYWSRQTSAQQRRHSVIKELDKLLNSNEVSSMFVMCQIYFFVCACVCVRVSYMGARGLFPLASVVLHVDDSSPPLGK